MPSESFKNQSEERKMKKHIWNSDQKESYCGKILADLKNNIISEDEFKKIVGNFNIPTSQLPEGICKNCFKSIRNQRY